MLNHTKKVKDIYNEVQKTLYYMIPDKWESLYLYCSILDGSDTEGNKGELFFYYQPKGIIKKKIINVYEIPTKFNLDENQYLKLVTKLYDLFKLLREEFKKVELNETWSNITILVQNSKFKVIYDYTDFNYDDLTSYERHIIWRYNYLNIGIETANKEEKNIIKKYEMQPKILGRKEYYETGIYISDIQNIIGYTTSEYITE